MGVFHDLTGQKFGMLTVIERVEDQTHPSGGHAIRYKCLCDCGNEYIISAGNLKRRNRIPSCGCYTHILHQINGENALARYNLKKYNTYDLTGDYGVGYTSKGEPFYFDLEDYDKIKDYLWYIDKDGGIICTYKKHTIQMHRLVINITDRTIHVDHIYHNRNDNRKSQLRLCTQLENQWNKGLDSRNQSGTTGVRWDKKRKKWIACICVKKKKIYLGAFIDKDDAIKARKQAEEKYFGEYQYKEKAL